MNAGETSQASEPRPIVVGFDGCQASRRALAYAADMARNAGQPLLVAYVTSMNIGLDMGFSGANASGPFADSAGLLAWLRTELADCIDLSTVRAEITERAGDAAHQLAELAAEQHANAVVVGAPEHKAHHLAGSVPCWLARHAKCPVVIVP